MDSDLNDSINIQMTTPPTVTKSSLLGWNFCTLPKPTPCIKNYEKFFIL